MVNFIVILTLLHILFVIVAIGAVTVTDYLHLVGLRKKKLEKQLKDIYPSLSRLINFSLILIYLSGIFLVAYNPSLLSRPLFVTKLSLVILVTLNGVYLQKKVSPSLDLCVMKGRKHCSSQVLYSSSISGSISIVTWYAIVILTFTKDTGYSVSEFITTYLLVLLAAILIALYFERKARKWCS